jgi:hypothetical protein
MSVPERVPENIALYRRPVLQLQYESTAINRQFPCIFSLCTRTPVRFRYARRAVLIGQLETMIVEIPEQFDRTESSRHQVPNHTDARLQELRLRRHHHRRSRTTTACSQGPIRPASATPQRPSCACDLECRPCCINQGLHQCLPVPTSNICTRTA